ncbi:MAG: 30S ribosome-binding factor RbfA [Myxococcota bacterium]
MGPIATPSIRPQRISSEIRRVLANCFTRKRPVALPGLVTIHHVQVASGCQHAKVFVSIYGSDSQCQEAAVLLSQHTGNFRHELTKGLRMRRIPQLTFVPDNLAAKTQDLCQLLDDLPRGDKPRNGLCNSNLK